jgi:hypothetical protein
MIGKAININTLIMYSSSSLQLKQLVLTSKIDLLMSLIVVTAHHTLSINKVETMHDGQ